METDNFTNREALFEVSKIDNTLRWLFYFLILLVGLSFLAILFCFTIWSTFANASRVVVSFISIGGAYLLGAAIVGFLFAIPKSRTFGDKSVQENQKSWYEDNTNLEEISDWLTKIIIGLTLVQLHKIMGLVNNSVENFSQSLASGTMFGSQLFYPWLYGLIVFLMSCGFIIGYLWTRINFGLILTIIRKRTLDIAGWEKKREQIEKEVSNGRVELEKIKDNVSSTATQKNIEFNESNKFIGEIDSIPNQDGEKLKQLINLAKSKPIIDKTDIQKGRWGGKNISNGKVLFAEIKPNVKIKGFFDVSIKVKSEEADLSVKGPIAIFVHDSFGITDNTIICDVINNEAKVDLLAYEAFTVGALCSDATELELDLNQVTGYPSDFYW